MRILDCDADKPMDAVCIYLTLSEARELADGVRILVDNPAERHIHVSDETFQREVTVTVYDEHNLGELDARSRRLMLEGT